MKQPLGTWSGETAPAAAAIDRAVNVSQHLQELGDKPELLVAGLMTGTSVDGLDIAICRISSTLDRMPELIDGRTVPFPAALRRQLLGLKDASVADLARADLALGRFQATALGTALAESGAGPLDLVGSHGQTAYHEHRVTTLQIGEPACIAQALGCPVVADFRRADVAAGGSGAPLVPVFDQLFLADPERTVLALNLGGIANFTLLHKDGGPPLAMDCGPGNMVVDGLVQRLSGGAMTCDEGGALAANRRVDEELLAELASHPALHTPPPRSLGREQFGDTFVEALIDRVKPSSDAEWGELIATATALTAEALARTCAAFAPARPSDGALVDRILVAGGGVHNATLLSMIEMRLPGVEVASTRSVGLDPDFKEAIAFAALAVLALLGGPVATGSFTGADREVRLGKLAFP